MKWKWLLLPLAAAAVFAVFAFGERSAPAPAWLLRYAENQPADYPTTRSAEYFAELVYERTGGDVKIVVYPDGVLGDENAVIRQMQFGGIDLARIASAQLIDQVEELSVLTLPYLYEDDSHMWKVLNSGIGDAFLEQLSEIDLVGLSWYDAGVRNFYTRRPIATLDDLRGMRIRVQEADYMSDVVRALGAVPVSAPYSEVYSSLSVGEVDGAENNWPSYEAEEHYRVAPYMLLDEHVRIPEVQLLSGVTAAELPDEYIQIIRECARESAQYERQLWIEREQEAQQRCMENGVTVTALTDPERERFRAACRPIYEAYVSEYAALIAEIQTMGA